MIKQISPIRVPFFQSFQGGRTYRKGDPDIAAWKFIRRVGTLDNLQAIAKRYGNQTEGIEVASLRINQAIELHEAAKNTSSLTRPLLLYYSALNLVRSVLLVRFGDMGGLAHGLRYKSDDDLLECSAITQKSGTFSKLLECTLEPRTKNTTTEIFTLKNLIAQIPELRHEYPLAGITESNIAEVHIEAFANAPTVLNYFIPNIDNNQFESNWKELLPWMADRCVHTGDKKLTLKQPLHSAEELQEFCNRNLWRDLWPRNNPIWFDQVNNSETKLLPRVAPYLAGLFILSNVSRYEPEILAPTVSPTNLSYLIESFLDCSERSIPLLVIELLEGPTYFE